jgi:hypothetical protein
VETFSFSESPYQELIAFTSAITPVNEQDTRSGLAHRGFAGDKLKL